MRTRYICAILIVSVGLLSSCTSTTTTTTRSETDATTTRVHTQEELRKTGESQTGPALEKTDASIRTSGNR
jgi:hypothetical protein